MFLYWFSVAIDYGNPQLEDNEPICFRCSPGPSETAIREGIPITCYIKMNLILTISEHMPHRVELTFKILLKSDICLCVF